MSSSLADCLFALSLPPTLFSEVLGLPKLSICVDILDTLPVCIVSAPTLFLQVLGLPKLSICVDILGRLPICVFSAPQIVFRGAGLAEADSLCRRPCQTAYLRVLCPEKCF